MSREISREYFVALSNDLLSGNITSVLRRLHCPCVVFVHGEPHLLRSPERLRLAVMRYRNLLLQRGAQAADISVVKTDLGVKSYIVSTTYLDRHGMQLGTARTRCFIKDHLARVEMIEYQANPFLEACDIKLAA